MARCYHLSVDRLSQPNPKPGITDQQVLGLTSRGSHDWHLLCSDQTGQVAEQNIIIAGEQWGTVSNQRRHENNSRIQEILIMKIFFVVSDHHTMHKDDSNKSINVFKLMKCSISAFLFGLQLFLCSSVLFATRAGRELLQSLLQMLLFN